MASQESQGRPVLNCYYCDEKTYPILDIYYPNKERKVCALVVCPNCKQKLQWDKRSTFHNEKPRVRVSWIVKNPPTFWDEVE